MKISRRKFLNKRALLMIRVNGFEVQQYAPQNFYNWSYKSQVKYLARFGNWASCCNGQPGGHAVYKK